MHTERFMYLLKLVVHVVYTGIHENEHHGQKRHSAQITDNTTH